MGTWHQEQARKRDGIRLWDAHETEWVVVCDKHGQPASRMSFTTRELAEINAGNSGGVLIPPLSETGRRR